MKLAAVAWALALGLVLAVATPARASDTQQSILMDDNQLIYAQPSHVKANMERIKALGVDVIKVSVVWSLVAPDASSSHEPHFDATDPNAYPRGAWARYDRVVELARQLGLTVYFQLTAPAPVWATTPGPMAFGAHPWSRLPNPREFGQFAEAVGRRYSGSFVPPGGAGQAPASGVSIPIGGNTLTIPGPSQSSPPANPEALPAVHWWGIWNEPNIVGWLSPQWRTVDHRVTPYSPVLERGLTDAGWAGLMASGHAGDTILIGETASAGNIKPTPFLRDLYCVGGNYRPLSGSAAARLGCPASPNATAFVAAHPALFHAAGYAHHPYSFDYPPPRPKGDGFVTLANLGGFEHALDRVFAAYGQPGGMPFYLTEWGYKTNPPNPFVKTSLTEQETWLNQGEFMSWENPRVRALAQFLLVDNLPRAGAARGTLSYWSTFQSGLIFANGRPKPALAAYRIPIWLPSTHPGRRVTVWGQLRPADHATLQYGVVDYRPSGMRSWEALTEIQTGSPEGYLVAHVSIPGPGSLRLAWLDPGSGVVYYSRSVTITR